MPTTLRQGDKGPEVRQAQQLLVSRAYPLAVDGVFGPKTKQAVEAFQPTHFDQDGAPLAVDGVIGPRTWWSLEHPGSTLNVTVDLSHHNGMVDLPKAKADGIVGVIHKATQGTGFIDEKYAPNKQKAIAAGLLWGAYHFGVGGDGEAQAEHFVKVVNPSPGVLLVLDFEPNPEGPDMTLAQARAFVSHVHARTGQWPGLYSGHYLRELLGDDHDEVLAHCWLWLARYGPQPVVPANWPTWTMWQYTDGVKGPDPHRVSGIGPCDRDQFQGDLAALYHLWGVAPPG